MGNIAKLYAQVFGAIALLIGILGFIPALTPSNELLGIFAVNAPHNVVHILTGVVALATGFSSDARYARWFAGIFGVVYGLVTVLGFISGAGNLLGFMAINGADNFLHLVIAASALGVYAVSGGKQASTARA